MPCSSERMQRELYSPAVFAVDWHCRVTRPRYCLRRQVLRPCRPHVLHFCRTWKSKTWSVIIYLSLFSDAQIFYILWITLSGLIRFLILQLCFSLCCSKQPDGRLIRWTEQSGWCGPGTGRSVSRRWRPSSAAARYGRSRSYSPELRPCRNSMTAPKQKSRALTCSIFEIRVLILDQMCRSVGDSNNPKLPS